MPELPEVQTTVNGIKKYLTKLSIKDVWTDYGGLMHANKDNIKNASYFLYFKKNIVGQKIMGAERRGKNVLIHLSNDKTILVHMKMTGHLMYGEYQKTKTEGKYVWRAVKAGPLRDDPYNRFIRMAITLSNGKHLVLSDMRRFAKVTLLNTEKINESPHLSKHGPEPLEKSFDKEALARALSNKPNMPVKLALMNHEIISGIGNIYSDEILWRVGIHPKTKSSCVPKEKLGPLLVAIKETLSEGLRFGGDSMSDYRNIFGLRGEFQNRHKAYRRTGQKCLKRGCKGVICRLPMGGRGAHFCDTHQRLYI